MSNEISLTEFIAKVEQDLKALEDLSTFFVEKAELEIHVTVDQEGFLESIAKEKSNLKISVLGKDFEKLQSQNVHTIKVTLAPILTKEIEVSGEKYSPIDEYDSSNSYSSYDSSSDYWAPLESPEPTLPPLDEPDKLDQDFSSGDTGF